MKQSTLCKIVRDLTKIIESRDDHLTIDKIISGEERRFGKEYPTYALHTDKQVLYVGRCDQGVEGVRS